MTVQTVPSHQDQIKDLYAEKGELLTQIEIAQSRLQQVNVQLANYLGLNQGQPQK